MLELRRIRTYTPDGATDTEAVEKSFKPQIYFKDLNDFLKNHEDCIQALPSHERFNLYVTCNQVKEDVEKRVENWLAQDLIMWDVDDVEDSDKQKHEQYLSVIAKVLGVKEHNLVLIKTGGGFHIVMQLKKAITDKQWFQKYSLDYQVLCAQIDDSLLDSGLSGALDTQVFAPNRMFRAPSSISKKPGRKDEIVEYLNPVEVVEAVDWDIQKATGLPVLDPKKDFLSEKELSYIKLDTETVKKECLFLDYCKKHPASVNEAQWYAMLSVVGRLENGESLAHEYSKGHPGYSPQKTDRKLKQALTNSGPRTCDNINKLWGGCEKCPFYKKCKSPITIKGPDFIATSHSGFHMINAKGALIPQYDDLRKFYDKKIPYKNVAGSHYRFDETKWTEVSDVYIEAYAEEQFSPPPKNTVCNEFKGKVKRTNLEDPEWFLKSTDRKISFKNGVLDIDTMELMEHSPKYGFRDSLDFDYDPEAEAHEFKKMLNNVTCGDTKMQTVLMEYLGYCMSNDQPKSDKILVLTGGGQNGKSRFLNVWKKLGGRGVKALGVSDLDNAFHLQQLDGALFNIMEEVPSFTDKNFWETMKKLATGGSVTVSRKFKDPYDFENKCKFIMTCNELPSGASQNHGFFRRLLIAEFNAIFSEELGNLDTNIDQRIIENEMPGVANIALKMYHRLKNNNYQFTKSEAMERSLVAYKRDIDSVARWAEMHVEIGPASDDGTAPEWIQKSDGGSFFGVIEDMRASYAEWCKKNGEKPVATKVFTARILSQLSGRKIGTGTKEVRKTRARFNGARKYVIEGITHFG